MNRLMFVAVGFIACFFLSIRAQTTNTAAATPPGNGAASSQTAELPFGSITISTQPTTEVTTLGYELTSSAADHIADRVFAALKSPSLHPPGTAAELDGLINAGSTVSAGVVADPKNIVSTDIHLIVVNQKRSALLTVEYEVMLDKLKYITVQTNAVLNTFDLTSRLTAPLSFQVSGLENKILYVQIVKLATNLGYDPALILQNIDFTDDLKPFTLVNQGTAQTPSQIKGAVTAFQEDLEAWGLQPSPNVTKALKQIAAPGRTLADQKTDAQTILSTIPNGFTPRAVGGNVLSQYIVPYVGQIQAGVDALTGLGQSAAKFVDLFRQSEVINGTQLTIPVDALNALVIAHLQFKEKNNHRKIHCYSADFLPDEVAGAGDPSGINQSRILALLRNLDALSDQLGSAVSRIDVTNSQVSPPPTLVPVDTDNPAIQKQILQSLQSFVQQLPKPVAGTPPATTISKAYKSQLQSLQTQLKSYQTEISQTLASLYGTGSSTSTTQNANGAGGSSQTSPGPAGAMTNQVYSISVPVTVSPTISPMVNVDMGTNASSSTNSATGKSPASTTSATASSSPSSPLEAILQQEALMDKLSSMPMLYVNVLSAGGANKVSTGWWSSDLSFNAGVAVDYFLTDTTGEVLASSVEDNQSPYLKAISHSDGERLPTVITTDKKATTKSDLDDLEHVEPETRFTTVPVHRLSVDNSDSNDESVPAPSESSKQH